MRLHERLALLMEKAGADAWNDDSSGTSGYARQGVVFAILGQADDIELRLGPEVADAARRTPDTHTSARGDDWVRFSPEEWDDHARDRLEAWFRVAWRFAGEGR